MDCNVDNCENKASSSYVWAWGEEGACCDAHRAMLESKSGQLSRGIAFTSLDERKPYEAPTLETISPEMGALKMQNAELLEKLKMANARIGELEVKIYTLEAQLDDHQATPATVIEGLTQQPPVTPVDKKKR